MVTEHFNELTEAQEERLAILIEECAEVQQIACKILRHGYLSANPKMPEPRENNQEMLERELGDPQHALQRMGGSGDVSLAVIHDRAVSKPERIKPYLHHQGPR
jgi:hypothetical protein